MNKVNVHRAAFYVFCYTILMTVATIYLKHHAGVLSAFSYRYQKHPRRFLEPVTATHVTANISGLQNELFRNIFASSPTDPREPANSSKLYQNGIVTKANNSFKNTSHIGVEEQAEELLKKPKDLPYILLDSDKEIQLRCKQCALVFSSGHLINSSMGKDIDDTECVIRHNFAPVIGHTKDVGMRTTIRVIGHSNLKHLLKFPRQRTEIFESLKTRASAIFVPWLYDEDIDKKKSFVYRIARRYGKNYRQVPFYFQSPEGMKWMDRLFTAETGLNRSEIHAWFSTGFMSMVFALDICEEVVCYGLSDAEYCSREPSSPVRYHYYTGDSLLECNYTRVREGLLKGGHKFLTERKLYAKWASGRNLTFRTPSWPKSAFNQDSNFTSPYLEIYGKAKADGSFDNFTNFDKIPADTVMAVKNSKAQVIRARLLKWNPSMYRKVN